MARARLTIDLDALVANWRGLDACSAGDVETAAVLKADAYGLGIDAVAPVLARSGVRSFFVALAEEGAALRELLGPRPSIYVFSGLMPGDVPLVRAYRLIPCLNNPAQLAVFSRSLAGRPSALQVDSGMNRLGFEPTELTDAEALVTRMAPVLVMSHLAAADMPGDAMNAAQLAAFAAAAARVPAARRSLAATGGILLGADYHFELVRPGIGVYGGRPFADAAPVVSLSLPVVQVRDVAPGEAVGYGAAWRAQGPTRVATVAAGYADGLPRALGGGGAALWAGKDRCPMIGRVSMDLITVDVSHLPSVPDFLEALGPEQTIDDLAETAGTIGYELLTSLGPRFERVYKGAAGPEEPATGRRMTGDE